MGIMFGVIECPRCQDEIEIDSGGGECEKCNLKFWEDTNGKIHHKEVKQK